MSVAFAFFDGLAQLDSAWVWSAALGSLVYAVFDHRDTWDEIKAAGGWKKARLWMKMFLLWAVPTVGLIGAYATSVNSDKSQAEFDSATNRVAALELHVMEAKTNIVQIDWRKKPIYAFSAKATVFVRPLEPVKDLENLPRNPPTWALDSRLRLPKDGNEQQKISLTLGAASRFFDDSWAGSGAMVWSDNVSRSIVTNWDGRPMALRFDIFFDEHSDNFSIGDFKPTEISGIELLLPLRCEVLDGEIKMAIDGGLTNFTFGIPPQTSMGDMISCFSTNGSFLPLNFNKRIMAEFEKEAHANGWDVPPDTNVNFLYPHK